MTAAGPRGFAERFAVPSCMLDVRSPAPGRRQGGGTLAPGVVLISRASDAEAGAVGALLARANVPNVRIDADRLAEVAVLFGPSGGHVSDGRCRIAPTVTWVRHFAATAIAPPPRPAADSPVTAQFTRESWAATVRQIGAASAVAIDAERPPLLVQYHAAARCQVTVPRTALANDLSGAAELIGSERLVVKVAHQHFVEAEPGLLGGIFPVVAAREELTGQRIGGTPLIVQEYIEHDAELRVYYIDGRVRCFEVGKAAPSDPWLMPDRVTARLVPTPAAVTRAVGRLAQAMGLRCAAFDFLLTGEDRVVFLEADPNGDWRWLERKAGLAPVTTAMAELLGGLHRARRPGMAASAGAASFNLLAFLTGGCGSTRVRPG